MPPAHVPLMGHGLARVALTVGRQKPLATRAVRVVVASAEQPKPRGHEAHVLAPVALSVASEGSRPRSSKKSGRQTHAVGSVAPGESVVVLNGHCSQASTCD